MGGTQRPVFHHLHLSLNSLTLTPFAFALHLLSLPLSLVLLANQITPSYLYNNTIKITDFGLAREIEHTTQMTGAGTYPWMAPEVIISNDFSTKCDVWRYVMCRCSLLL